MAKTTTTRKTEEVKVEEQKKEKMIEKPVISDNRQYIYIGDNLGFSLIQNTVYQGGIPKNVVEMFGKCPELRTLLVPLDKYVEAKKRLTIPGTAEFLANKTIKGVRE